MTYLKRLTQLEEIAAERQASNKRCVCRLVHTQVGIPQSPEERELLERNRLCRESDTKAHGGFSVVEIAPLPFKRTEDEDPPRAA